MRITVDTSSEINFGALTMSNGARLKGRLMRESGSPICFEDVILVRTHTAERVDSFQDVNRIVVTTNAMKNFRQPIHLRPASGPCLHIQMQMVPSSESSKGSAYV